MRVTDALPEHARGKPLEVWFQDEARVGQQGTLTRIWAPRGTRPRAPRDTRYTWAFACSLEPVAFASSLFGAVCPERGTTAALVMPHADSAAMNAHLAEISRPVAVGAHAVLVLDGAGWHGAKALKVPDNITVLPLPPYAPERNPIENVWAYLRANRLAISVFESYDEILSRCGRRGIPSTSSPVSAAGPDGAPQSRSSRLDRRTAGSRCGHRRQIEGRRRRHRRPRRDRKTARRRCSRNRILGRGGRHGPRR